TRPDSPLRAVNPPRAVVRCVTIGHANEASSLQCLIAGTHCNRIPSGKMVSEGDCELVTVHRSAETWPALWSPESYAGPGLRWDNARAPDTAARCPGRGSRGQWEGGSSPSDWDLPAATLLDCLSQCE